MCVIGSVKRLGFCGFLDHERHRNESASVFSSQLCEAGNEQNINFSLNLIQV